MIPTIINIMPHGPAYDFSPDEKPDFYWEKPGGSILGFWKREWPDLIGEAVLKKTGHFKWEVWQPDYRADKIYSKTIGTGVTHYLFPAEEKIYRPGIRKQCGVYSQPIINRLNELKDNRIILHLHGFRVPFYNDLIEIFGGKKAFPIFLTGHGMSKAPISELFGLHKPLTYLCLLVEQIRLKRLLKYVNMMSEYDESALRQIRRIYTGRIEKITTGCDFDFWSPLQSPEVKKCVREKLGIPLNSIVFFATGNFVPRKQLDKLIKCFSSIRRDDFFLLIAGHGDTINTSLLKSLITPLENQKKALLHPYIEEQGLRDLYWASDVYISTATDEGGPVSVMKAMACGLPVLSTPAGDTTEIMKKHNAGMFIPVYSYTKWTNTIIDILDHGFPHPINLEDAREAYDWNRIAQRFIDIYDELLLTYQYK